MIGRVRHSRVTGFSGFRRKVRRDWDGFAHLSAGRASATLTRSASIHFTPDFRGLLVKQPYR